MTEPASETSWAPKLTSLTIHYATLPASQPLSSSTESKLSKSFQTRSSHPAESYLPVRLIGPSARGVGFQFPMLPAIPTISANSARQESQVQGSDAVIGQMFSLEIFMGERPGGGGRGGEVNPEMEPWRAGGERWAWELVDRSELEANRCDLGAGKVSLSSA